MLSAEKKVGITVLISLLCLIALVLFVSHVHFHAGGYRVKVMFHFVDSLKPDGAVLMGGGVQIGMVESIKAVNEMVEVDCFIQKQYAVAKDSEFTIHTNGILGEKYVEIYQGDSKAGLIADGDTIQGSDPGSLDRTMQGFEKLADALSGLLQDEKTKHGLSDTLRSTNHLVKELADLVEETRGNLQVSIQHLRSLSENFDKASGHAAHAMQSLDELTNQKNRENAEASLEHLRASLEKLDRMMSEVDSKKGPLGAMIYDEEAANNVRDLLRDLKNHPWKLLWKK